MPHHVLIAAERQWQLVGLLSCSENRYDPYEIALRFHSQLETLMLERLNHNFREVFLLICTLVGALVLEQLYSLSAIGHFSFSVFGAVCALTIIASAIAVLVYTWLTEQPLKMHLQRIASQLPEGILVLDQTKELERNSREVWIVTNDFYWDLQTKYFEEVVFPNIGKGKSYTYFCPDRPRSHDAAQEILMSLEKRANDVAKAKGLIEFIYVPSELFETVLFEFAIFNPKNHRMATGILSDISGKRYKNSNESLDMILDKDVLPKFIELTGRWRNSFGSKQAMSGS